MSLTSSSIFEGVISNLIANSFTSIAVHLWRNSLGRTTPKKPPLTQSAKAVSLSGLIQKEVAATARKIHVSDKRTADRIRAFLVTPEAEACVRQIIAGKISGDSESLELVRDEFQLHLNQFAGRGECLSRELSDSVFDTVVAGCQKRISIEAENGVLGAHEAQSASRHRLLLDELAAVKTSLAFLTSGNIFEHRGTLEFEQRYRQQVGTRHRHIRPPHFDAARSIHIDKLYVASDFIRVPSTKAEEPIALNFHQFLAESYRGVILGTPGGGKSTFAQKLCHDLSKHYNQRLFGGRLLTPVLVILRDYGSEKKASGCSILQFIEGVANSKYQMQAPPGCFEYLFLNGRAVVIFDGLDELLDTSYRQEISDDVESFCNLYPAVPVLITSREVGYEQAPLDEEMFQIYRLTPFNEGQVRDYATKWFSVDAELSKEQQKKKAGLFLDESAAVGDLRSNPLMLALMCNIYRGENYIPRNRPEVYEKCALMLFERWDKGRGILVPLPIESHVNPAMKFLAHWIFSDEALQGGVTEGNLVNKATEYLCSWRYEDRHEAEKAAKEFISFCRGRAWVFTDTGTQKEGERLYQFTHRTFLEYFTAAHLVRIYPTPESLVEFLRPRIDKREWDVVSQLAFQLLNKNVEGAGETLLSDLISHGRSATASNLLSFAARCLEFLVPKPQVTREIVRACIDRAITWGISRSSTESPGMSFSPDEGARELLSGLIHSADENRSVVKAVLEEILIHRINHGKDSEALVAIEIGLHLLMGFGGRTRRHTSQRDLFPFWRDASERVFAGACARIQALSEKHFDCAYEALRKGKIPLAQFLEIYGIDGLFRVRGFRAFPNVWMNRIAESMLDAILSFRDVDESRKKFLEEHAGYLNEFGSLLLAHQTPFVSSKRIIGSFTHFVFDPPPVNKDVIKSKVKLTPDGVFGAFVLLAIILESRIEHGEPCDKFLVRLAAAKSPVLDQIHGVVRGRFENAPHGLVEKGMQRLTISTKQREFISRWLSKDISLVRHEPEEVSQTVKL